MISMPGYVLCSSNMSVSSLLVSPGLRTPYLTSAYKQGRIHIVSKEGIRLNANNIEKARLVALRYYELHTQKMFQPNSVFYQIWSNE